ncbi:MAG TPA: SNF2-related protein [Chitinophagales bacterium]|nr:SNF2-related protein [Chitinophagales bacterium]
MTSGFLLNYIKYNSLDKVRDRAKFIYPELVAYSDGNFDFQCDGSNGESYNISIQLDETDIQNIRCSCPYRDEGLCKHLIASINFLINKKGNKTLFPEGLLHSKMLPATVSNGKYYLKDDLLDLNLFSAFVKGYYHERCELLKVSFERIQSVTHSWETFHQVFEYDKSSKILTTTCTCLNSKGICEHRILALKTLVERFGEDFFTTYYLEDKISKVLSQYGMTTEDDYHSIFQFELTPTGLNTISKYKNIQPIHYHQKALYANEEEEILLNQPYLGDSSEQQMGVGLCIEMNKSRYIGMYPVVAKYNKTKTDFASTFLSLTSTYLEKFLDKTEDDYDLGFLLKMLRLREFFYKREKKNPQQLAKAISVMNGLWPELKDRLVYEYNPKNTLVRKNLSPLIIEDTPVEMLFSVTENEVFYNMKAKVKIGENTYAINSTKIRIGDFFVIVEDKVYPIKDAELSLRLNEYQQSSESNYFKKSFEEVYQNNLLPLSKNHEVQLQFAKKDRRKIENSQIEKQVYIKDVDGKFISFQPMVQYVDKQIPVSSKEQMVLFSKDGLVAYIERNQSFEDDFLEEFQTLHPDFSNQQKFFYLSPEQLLEDYWFLHAVERMKQLGIQVFGANDLKSFKFNVNKPNISISLNSEIDWFDIIIQISFGKQKVDLKDLKKSFIKKSNYVLLGDGTLGVLPENWMKKFATYFQTGQIKKDALQISNYQFGIIDELYEVIEHRPSFLIELYEKKQRLQNISEIKSIPIPKGIKAKLRDYQHHGLNWLAFLDQNQLGGCLADDMGLGKTLQTITFLQHLKITQNNKTPSLIIAPTSLMFNWNKELEKFCPSLKVLTFVGSDRIHLKHEFEQYDIILSTYGSLLNDIEFLKDEPFHYVILDESQAIKNPNSKRYKAVRLLQSYNRIVLTGTPIENNTFDLFAQLNFLNPGLLGSMAHFKTTFSDKIDKEKDEEASLLLSKIIAPFVLRRTKEDVAKELPEKTEDVIYCEMGKDQRKVYDSFKDKYRDYLLNKIDENGVAKSQMYILEGLTKLRQICNSTSLINEEEDYGNFSVKTEILLEHIKEKTGHHKILVFSQFVKMLQIIKTRLDEEHISYEYLDGQTKDRQARVDNFQENKDVRVFLISLKAGGVGLNLTEADYVYIVDPWWNPAVENQAIDRCYRIGQNKKVMAYRMICKDTIEEKIVSLQSKKKQIAASIISVDEEKKSFDLDEVKSLFM